MLQKLHRPDLGLLIIRIILGIMFAWHGYQKLTGLEETIGFFSTLGLPALVAYLVVIIELLGGILLILGFFVPIVSLLLAAVMVGAISFTGPKGSILFGHEYEIVLLCITLGLAMLGGGALSVQSMMKKNSAPVQM